MAIFDDVIAQMTEAMKAKDAARLAALRGIRAAFLNETKKDNSKSLADDVCISLLRRLEKQRNESIEAFEAAGRPDRVAEERAELAVVQEFLPRLADDAKTRAWVAEAIAATQASKPADVGRVMAAVMKAHKGDVDGNLAKKIASELLSA
ncbi:MAG TPA: GatB/YqeY domain-containing protein [Myxococcota bacterium]|nr:GatB/YqeY domain-containing protein [Myxococcota bacterium]